MEKLRKLLTQIDGGSYKAYKDIKGSYQFSGYTLTIDHVQGDPFAAPSRVSIRVPMSNARFSDELWMQNKLPHHGQPQDGIPIRKIALEDYLSRAMRRAIRKTVKGHRGSGGSGEVNIETSKQQVLLRNAIAIEKSFVEARIVVGLPANGRRVAGRQAIAIFFDELPKVVERSLLYENLNKKELQKHIESIEDQEALRLQLKDNNIVAFVANGSILPRLSGVDDRPLDKDALAFQAPESLSYDIELPNSGKISGMGIPQGITLIVGGGFHGKSTLLHAVERGIHNHIPGDGREKVATNPTAVKVRAEDGRAISKVNISPFIDRLPFGRDTKAFNTENASGSTSQAANIIEAFETGTEVLLIDEDTSATNFMIRDERMQTLVAQDKEPITPLLYRVRELYDAHGVSSVIVMGGSGDYFDVADTVIMMDSYEPKDVTLQAKALARNLNDTYHDKLDNLPQFSRSSHRRPCKKALDPSRRNRDVKIDTKGLHTILYGDHHIDLSLVEQLIDIGQTRSIGLIIHYYATHYANNHSSLVEGLGKVLDDINQQGLDVISPYKVGNLALPRLHEIAAAINRIREGDWH
ncbi:ABC-ATPase domain-containing protein [Kaarinaea lacus]